MSRVGRWRVTAGVAEYRAPQGTSAHLLGPARTKGPVRCGRRGCGTGGGITVGYGFVIAVVIVALLLAWNGVKIVREYQRLVVLRLGRSFGPK
jgi:hypothetical protein